MTTWRANCQRQDFGKDAGPFTGGPTKIVLHSTETGTWPGYQGGSVAPHETWRWTGSHFEKRQHISHTRSAMAMKNAAGGVQTNRDSAHQIELVGSCDPGFATKYGYVYLPGQGDDFLRELGKEIRQLAADVDCPVTAVREWRNYPASYGFRSSQRMSLSEWDNFTGICGHQHAAENDHGDPGSLNVARALELSGATVDVIDKPVPVQPRKPGVVEVVLSKFGKAPKFPLPAGHYFGPKSGPRESHSGYYGADDRAELRVFQSQLRKRGWTIDVDGLYGAQTAKVVGQFQQEKRLGADQLIGPKTWAAAWAK